MMILSITSTVIVADDENVCEDVTTVDLPDDATVAESQSESIKDCCAPMNNDTHPM